MTRCLMLVILCLWAVPATAGNNPADENWWPSEFGPDDQAGAVKYITLEKVVQAAQLVKKGMTATLGRPYHNGMPLLPGRSFALSIPGGGTPTHGPLNWGGDSYQMTFMDELLTADIGQVGTQWDGLGLPMNKVAGVPGWEDGNYFHNGFRLEDVGSLLGLNAVGVKHLAEIGFFTRGILIDIAALKGVDRLDKGYAITMADYEAALAAHGIDDASQGDVVLFRTGWNSLLTGRNSLLTGRNSLLEDYSSIDAAKIAEFGSGEPGVSPEVCDHLAAKKISMIGSDTWGLDPYDFSQGVPGRSYLAYCHMNLNAGQGVTNFGNLDLGKLSREKAYEFAFSWSPLKLVGTTGSPGNPVAAW